MSGPVAHVGGVNAHAKAQEWMQSDGWKFFERQMDPAKMPNPFRPAGDMLKEISRYSETEQGKAFFAWLHSITDLAPYPNVNGGNLEQVAVAAAKHDGRALVGRMIAAALAEGKELRNQEKG